MSTQPPAGPSSVTDWSSGRFTGLAFVIFRGWRIAPHKGAPEPRIEDSRERRYVKPTLSARRDRPPLAIISDSPRRSDCLVPYQDDEERIWRCCSSNRRGRASHPARLALPALPLIRWQSSIASSHNHCWRMESRRRERIGTHRDRI